MHSGLLKSRSGAPSIHILMLGFCLPVFLTVALVVVDDAILR